MYNPDKENSCTTHNGPCMGEPIQQYSIHKELQVLIGQASNIAETVNDIVHDIGCSLSPVDPCKVVENDTIIDDISKLKQVMLRIATTVRDIRVNL